MSQKQVNSALFKAVMDSTSSLIEILPLRWPNVDFSAPVDSQWGAVDVIPNRPEAATLGERGDDEFTGILQVTLNFPIQLGTGDLVAMFDRIRAFFPAGKSLPSADDSVSVRVISCSMTEPRKNESHFRSFISIGWRARIARPPLDFNISPHIEEREVMALETATARFHNHVHNPA